jgi:signal transduction histidine kinase
MTNLIGNAVKFTPKVSVAITVSQHGSDDETPELILEVTDTGVGIAEEKLSHIFDEFNQGDNEKSRQFEGTGLGLSICKRLVDLMGGEITVRSTEGKGSSFTVNLKLPHMPQDRLKHPNVDLLPSKITEDI